MTTKRTPKPKLTQLSVIGRLICINGRAADMADRMKELSDDLAILSDAIKELREDLRIKIKFQ